MYQYVRARDEDMYILELLYGRAGSFAFGDQSRIGISARWRAQQDMETIRAAANPEWEASFDSVILSGDKL